MLIGMTGKYGFVMIIEHLMIYCDNLEGGVPLARLYPGLQREGEKLTHNSPWSPLAEPAHEH